MVESHVPHSVYFGEGGGKNGKRSPLPTAELSWDPSPGDVLGMGWRVPLWSRGAHGDGGYPPLTWRALWSWSC